MSPVAEPGIFGHTAAIQCGQVLGISMWPFAHAFTAKAKEPARSECMVKGPFCVLGLGMPPRRLNTIRGMSRTREDESSHRERVEDSSASLTRMHGVVESSQKAHQPMVEQRVLFDVCEGDLTPLLWVGSSFTRSLSQSINQEQH